VCMSISHSELRYSNTDKLTLNVSEKGKSAESTLPNFDGTTQRNVCLEVLAMRVFEYVPDCLAIVYLIVSRISRL